MLGLNLNEIEQDHDIATQPQWWGDPDRHRATVRLLEQIPALVEELTQAREELAELNSLFCAVDNYLHSADSNSYPDDYCNPKRLAALRDTFLVLVDAPIGRRNAQPERD